MNLTYWFELWKRSWSLTFHSLSLQSWKWAKQHSATYLAIPVLPKSTRLFPDGGNTWGNIDYSLSITEVFWKNNHINKSSVSKLRDWFFSYSLTAALLVLTKTPTQPTKQQKTKKPQPPQIHKLVMNLHKNKDSEQ